MKAEWEKWEEQVAAELNGKITPGSGNQWHSQGDVITLTHVISCKQTAKTSFTVTKDDWREVEKIAAGKAKGPAMALEIDNLKLVVISYEEYVAYLNEMGAI